MTYPRNRIESIRCRSGQIISFALVSGLGFGGDGAVSQAPGVVAGLKDVAVVDDAVEQHGGHLGVAEDLPRVGEGQVGSDDQTGALVELVDEMKHQRAA